MMILIPAHMSQTLALYHGAFLSSPELKTTGFLLFSKPHMFTYLFILNLSNLYSNEGLEILRETSYCSKSANYAMLDIQFSSHSSQLKSFDVKKGFILGRVRGI